MIATGYFKRLLRQMRKQRLLPGTREAEEILAERQFT